jgi:DNA repair/transcription protein MET18/MMS19
MMVEPNQLVQHLETFVDTNRSSSQQDDSLKAIASSLENDSLSITQLVTISTHLTTSEYSSVGFICVVGLFLYC